ncbi:MAG: hypothetical protein V7K69_10645 [Nostoc sp.]
MMAQLQKSAQSQLKQYLGENLDTPTLKESNCTAISQQRTD